MVAMGCQWLPMVAKVERENIIDLFSENIKYNKSAALSSPEHLRESRYAPHT
jgi:hypothetical protein